MNEAEQLLQAAANEIMSLRRQNELMGARLEMFDSIMSVLHTQPAFKNQGMSPDLVYQINKFIQSKKDESIN